MCEGCAGGVDRFEGCEFLAELAVAQRVETVQRELADVRQRERDQAAARQTVESAAVEAREQLRAVERDQAEAGRTSAESRLADRDGQVQELCGELTTARSVEREARAQAADLTNQVAALAGRLAGGDDAAPRGRG